MSGVKATPIEERIWWHIDVAGLDDCWLWTAALYGRGHARIDDRHVSRVILGLEKGNPIIARHKCDNPPCCNPAHLEPGTHQDNADDQTRRGRRPCGERRPDARLTEKDVHQIRADGRVCADIAADYGVSASLVVQIKRGNKWAHVPVSGPVVLRVSKNSPELTEKQLRILELHVRGKMNASDIAKHLRLGKSLIQKQLKSIYRKLGDDPERNPLLLDLRAGVLT